MRDHLGWDGLASDGNSSRITYTETIDRVNYVPYSLSPWLRPIFRPVVNRADRKQLANLATLPGAFSVTSWAGETRDPPRGDSPALSPVGSRG